MGCDLEGLTQLFTAEPHLGTDWEFSSTNVAPCPLVSMIYHTRITASTDSLHWSLLLLCGMSSAARLLLSGNAARLPPIVLRAEKPSGAFAQILTPAMYTPTNLHHPLLPASHRCDRTSRSWARGPIW